MVKSGSHAPPMRSGEGGVPRLAAPTEITGNKGWFPKAKCMLQPEGQWKGVFNAKKKGGGQIKPATTTQAKLYKNEI